MSGTKGWSYVGTSTRSRRDALEHPRPASELVATLRDELSLACCHRDPGHTDPSYERTVFCGTVQPALFDWFFNASSGYRGAYFESPESGLQLNRALIDALTPTLANWATAQEHETDIDWMLASLAAKSAKIWLAEHPGLCPACAGEWGASYVSDLHIRNGRWEHATHTHADWGCQAPLLTKVRIFGGLVNSQGEEWIAAHKVGRATHIFQHGWS